MERVEAAAHMVERMKAQNVDKAQVFVTSSNRHELCVGHGETNMLRSMENTGIQVKAIAGQKLGTAMGNGTEPSELDTLCDKAIEMAEGSPSDSAYDIAPLTDGECFNRGPQSPDLEGMHHRLTETLHFIRDKYPQLKVDDGGLEYIMDSTSYLNSNGVQLESHNGRYQIVLVFLAKEEKKTSSANYFAYSFGGLDRPLLEGTAFEAMLQQSIDHLNPRSVGDKFVGDVIIAPDCLGQFIGPLASSFLSDRFIVANRGFLKDKVGQAVASSAFSLHSRPLDDAIVEPSFVTSDGFKTQNATLISQGVLQSYMLSLYGANKTGHQRFTGAPGNFVVDTGDKSMADQIAAVERGILLNAYSGSYPDDRGDFSGVAKNSYYIEGGKIQYPLHETMISGNLATLLAETVSTSSESINFGSNIFPWVHTKGVTISGKS